MASLFGPRLAVTSPEAPPLPIASDAAAESLLVEGAVAFDKEIR